jgi:hypothetical protein
MAASSLQLSSWYSTWLEQIVKPAQTAFFVYMAGLLLTLDKPTLG